jgi:hypothetical protein
MRYPGRRDRASDPPRHRQDRDGTPALLEFITEKAVDVSRFA